MSCWVVPAIAADLWRVPVRNVLGRIEEGSIPTKIEHGFVLVEIEPQGDSFRPLPRPRVRGAETFTVVSDEELMALHVSDPAKVWAETELDGPTRDRLRLSPAADTWADAGPVEETAVTAEEEAAFAALVTADAPISAMDETPAPPPDPESHNDEELGPLGDPDPDNDQHVPDHTPPLDWRATRLRVGRTRKPPGRR